MVQTILTVRQVVTQAFRDFECVLMFLASRVHVVNLGLTMFHMVDRESQEMAATLSVKAASELLVRFFLAILVLCGRSEVKVLLRADQEVTVTLVLREAQARLKQGTLQGLWVVAPRRVPWNGQSVTLISWMVPPCCWLHCRYHVRLDGRISTKCCETAAAEAGLPVSEKTFGHEVQERGCCVASSK